MVLKDIKALNTQLWRVDSSHFLLRVFNKNFVGVDASGKAVAQALTSDGGEIFEIVRHAGDSKRVRLRASNGQFLQATTKDSVTANSGGDGSWGSDDPSTFLVTIMKNMTGEYQVTNGYRPDVAPAVMQFFASVARRGGRRKVFLSPALSLSPTSLPLELSPACRHMRA